MGKKSKIKPTSLPTASHVASAGKIRPSPVSFNFQRLKEGREKFIYTTREGNYFLKFLERVKNISGQTKQEMVNSNARCLRCHKIDFRDDKVTEDTFGFGEEIDDDAWQFQISSNEHGRVHGYFVGDIFYIVWLDPDHQLYQGA